MSWIRRQLLIVQKFMRAHFARLPHWSRRAVTMTFTILLWLLILPFRLVWLAVKGIVNFIGNGLVGRFSPAVFITLVAGLLIGSFCLTSYLHQGPAGVTAYECQQLARARGSQDPATATFHSYDRSRQRNVDSTTMCQLPGLEGEGPRIRFLLVDTVIGRPVSNGTTSKVMPAEITPDECRQVLHGVADGGKCRVPATATVKSRQFNLGTDGSTWITPYS